MKQQPSPSNHFVSFKTVSAVPISSPLVRDLLIQSTLDATVRSVGYVPTVFLDGRVVAVKAIHVRRDDGLFAIDMPDAHGPGDVDQEGFLALAFERSCSGIIQMSAADLRAEPRFSSARTVWRHSAIRIHANDRSQVMEALECEGPLPLRALEGLVSTRHDAISVAYAMATEGTVTLDMRDGLDGRTIVRAGTMHRPRHLAYGT